MASGSGSILGAGAAIMGSSSVPPLGGAYKYNSGGSGIGGQIGSLGQAPSYNFGSIPKYTASSGIAGSIGQLNSGGNAAEEPFFGGRNKF